jgi:aminodeoxyfutalosine deaminase
MTARRALVLARRDERTDIPAGLVQQDDRPRWEFDDLLTFLELFGWSTRLLRDASSYVDVLKDLLRSLDEQDIREAELFVAIGQMHRMGTDPTTILPALARVAAEHADRGGCQAWFIADSTRQWGASAAERVLDTALDLRAHRIVGFGMGGDERGARAREFRALFRRAREHGLGTTCHAGEGTTPDAVLEVVEELEVTRVGHGISATQDPDLMRQLAAAGIVLEVCPTSNRRTRSWDGEGRHPLFTLLEHGVPCILGSDDPAYFGSSLRGEIEWAVQEGLDRASIEAMCARSLDCGFV